MSREKSGHGQSNTVNYLYRTMMHIGIVGNGNLDAIASALNDLMPASAVVVGAPGAYQQELSQPFGDFLGLDIIIIVLDWRPLTPKLYGYAYGDDPITVHREFCNQCNEILDLIRKFRAQTTSQILVFSPVSDWTGPLGFYSRLLQPSPIDLFLDFQKQFNLLCRSIPLVYPVDLEEIAGLIGRECFYDVPALSSIDVFSKRAINGIAKRIRDIAVQLERYPLKCLVLDCDDTLWGGIVGEDGFDHVKLGTEGVGRAYYNFQAEIVRLYKQGVLLVLCSKNNTCDVLDIMERHESMLIRPSMIACFRVNWDDKPASIASAAAELNIGLDSMMFIDDNPAERALIRSALPQVTVFDLPGDPFLYAFAIKMCSRFWPVELTHDDTQRNTQYAVNKIRSAAAAQTANVEAFLAQSDITVTMACASAETLPRIVQLINKTNQFTLTGSRISLTELESKIRLKGNCCFCMSMVDNYGDYGIMAAALILQGTLDIFVVSCRAFGKQAEKTFLLYLMAFVKKQGLKKISGRFIAAPRNSMVNDFYHKNGFVQTAGSGDEVLWEYDLTIPLPAPVSWITVVS